MLTIESYNKDRKESEFNVDLKAVMNWYKASLLVGKVIPIKAIGSHKSKFGFSVFAITDNGDGINLPSFEKETIDIILNDEKACSEIKEGKVSMKILPYKTKAGYETCRIKFIPRTALNTNSLYGTFRTPSKEDDNLPF